MSSPGSGHDFEFRHVQTSEGFRQVEEAQVEAWGMTTEHPVPSPLQRALEDNGGLVLGAFDGDRLAGFSLGFLGRDRDGLFHYSHMTAVRPAYQGRELGFSLKSYQREEVLKQGLTEIRWTFDPLQSQKAVLNVRRLGARPETYHVRYYGEMGSEVDRGLETDRVRVRWDLTSALVRKRVERRYPSAEQDRARWRASEPTIHTAVDRHGLRTPTDVATPSQPWVTLEIPFDLPSMRSRAPDSIAAWREASRKALGDCFAAGYRVDDVAVIREGPEPRTFYFLSKGRRAPGGHRARKE